MAFWKFIEQENSKEIRRNQTKNNWFEKRYSVNPNYRKLDMNDCFKDSYLQNLVKEVFELEVQINPEDLKIKSNQS